MPKYEYKCSEGHEFEVDQHISDEKLKKCIKCDAPVKRLISMTSFVLKGKGWAKDGYSEKK